MPHISELSSVIRLYQIVAGMSVLFGVGAIAALIHAYRTGIFSHKDDIAVRMLDFEDRPLAKPSKSSFPEQSA